jgi:hypothetical protein
MTADSGQDTALDLAARRLERALALLEERLARRLDHAGDAFSEDRANLASELDAARARERALEEAGEAAYAALSHAIAEIRSVLGEERS